jgi:hypothetical protein
MAAGVFDTRVLPKAEQLACTAPLEFLGCLLGCQPNTSSGSSSSSGVVVPGGSVEGGGGAGGGEGKWGGPEAQEAALRLQVGWVVERGEGWDRCGRSGLLHST